MPASMDHVMSASDVQALPVLLILFRFISYLPAMTMDHVVWQCICA